MKHRKNQRGYTLLEYAAGAAILMGILYAGLNTLGAGVNNLLVGLSSWATQQRDSLTGGSGAGH